MRFTLAVMLALLALALGAAAQDVDAPAELRPVRDHVLAGIEAGVAPSCAVAVVREGELIWAEGFGLADREKERKATATTIYLLASVSKPITATGLMKLVDRGAIDLDRPVNDYLPGPKLRAYEGDAADITVRRLASHLGGLPVHYSFFYHEAPPAMDETIRRYGFAVTPPGSRWEYSNLGFGILGYVTEVVAKKPWREFLEEEVFDPLRMTRTSTRVRPEHEACAARPYALDVGGRFIPLPRYRFDHPGASAVWSSALDLARFVSMHLNDGELDGVRILKPETARQMRAPATKRRSGDQNGIAWFLGRAGDQTRISHGGGMPGVSTRVAGYPETKSAIVVLTNSSRRQLTEEVFERIERTLFPEEGDATSFPPFDGADRTSFRGTWKGVLRHFAGDIPVELEVQTDDEVKLAVGRSGPRRPTALRWGEEALTLTTAGAIETQTGYHGSSELRFTLWRRGEGLRGVCVARADGYYALSHWVELERAGPAEAPRARFERKDAPAVSFVPPAGWKAEASSSRMRLAQYAIGEGDGALTCIVYFFGAGGGGGVQANIDRWTGQIEGPPAKTQEIEVADGVRATLVRASGTYVAAVRPGAARRHDDAGSRLLAAILEMEGGPLFIKMVGPEKAVAAAEPAFDAWVASFRLE